MMENRPRRNSRIELLRIVSMLMIVAHHYAVYGFYAEELAFSRNKIFVDLFGMGVRIGVDLFVLISGYYLVRARFRLKKLLMLMGSVWFYMLLSLLLVAVTGLYPLDRTILRGVCFPLLTSQYWFASYYALLLLFSPFLNALIRNLSRGLHAALCLLLFTLCTLLPELLHVSFAGGMLPLFAALYLCGGYARLYLPAGERIARRALLLALGLWLLCALRVGIGDRLAQRAGDFQRLESSLAFLDVYSPLAFAIAFLLLLAACTRRPADWRFLSRVGGLCFGVYLFHANPVVNSVVWQRVFRTAAFVDSPWLPLHAVGTTAALFAAGCLVELLRLRTAAPLWERGVDALSPRLEALLRRAGQAGLRLADRVLGTERGEEET